MKNSLIQYEISYKWVASILRCPAVANIKQNDIISHEMNTVNNEIGYKLKHSSKDCMKTPATENKYKKLENCQPQIEKPDYRENKIKIDEMNQN